jgi:uncharacterized repeat protein (TIGR04052 family)
MTTLPSASPGVLLAAFFVSACAGGCIDEIHNHGDNAADVVVPFVAVVDGADFACDGVYEGVGTGASSFSPRDARFYVHGLTLLAGSEERPVTLDDDGAFQADGVALLDFEDDSGTCETGSARTNTALVGKVASLDGVTGLRFTVGVPLAKNHLDAATAAPPLNDPGMFWAWSSGYKHMKIEATTAVKNTVYFHLGAQTCNGDPGSFVCAHENTTDVTLDYRDGDTVVVDIGAIYARIDVDAALAAGDSIDGCMSFDNDPQCAPMFGAVGLSYEGSEAPAQSVFTVR